MLEAFGLVLALTAPPVEEATPRPDLVRWRKVAEGEAESRSSARPVLYLFTADWCPPCVALKRNVFSQREIADLIEENFVPVEVDDVRDANQQRTPEVEALEFRFLVGRLPTLVVSRPGGGPAVSEDGAPVYSRMVRFVRTARERLQNLEKRFASEGKTPR